MTKDIYCNFRVGLTEFNNAMETFKMYNNFAEAEYKPREDITIQELSRVVQILFRVNGGPRLTTRPTVIFTSIDSYNLFIKDYYDILKHFEITVYGNEKK